MTISKETLVQAKFWDVEVICLSCGAEGEEHAIGPCSACGEDLLVNPTLALMVLDNVEVLGEEEELG